MAAANCDENEENYVSDTCNTNRSEMDKNFLVYVSVEGISSFTRKMEKIYGVEKDEVKTGETTFSYNKE